MGLRAEKDAPPFIVAHRSAIGPKNPSGDRFKHRIPPKPASATAHLPPAFPFWALGLHLRLWALALDLQPQVQLGLERVTPFPSHLQVRRREPDETADGRLDTSEVRNGARAPFPEMLCLVAGQVNHSRTPAVSHGWGCDQLPVHLGPSNVIATPAGRDSPRTACRPANACRHERPAGGVAVSSRSLRVEQLEKACVAGRAKLHTCGHAKWHSAEPGAGAVRARVRGSGRRRV